MSLTTSKFSIARSSLLALVALAFLGGAPASATWSHKQDVQWPLPNGCYAGLNYNTQCTLGLPNGFIPCLRACTKSILAFGGASFLCPERRDEPS